MQPGGWAAALRKGLKHADDDYKNDGEPNRSGSEAPAQGEVVPPAAAPVPLLTGKAAKAAARQRLLAEALKSRANAVTGERHCLACGRGFLDLSRFAQHIADRHGGVNSAEAPSQAPPPVLSSFPALAPTPAPLRLSDVAVVRKGHVDASNKTQHAPRKSGVAAPGAAVAAPRRPAAAAAAFQAPEGTRARRKKRPSKLKRGYMRSKAAAAVEHWLSVLSAVEEALQVAGEAHGATVNEAVAARAKLEAASSREVAAGLFVRLQVLKAQERGAVERLEGLCGVHYSARAHLVKAQALLREVEGSGTGGNEEDGAAEAKGQSTAAVPPPPPPPPEPQPAPEPEPVLDQGHQAIVEVAQAAAEEEAVKEESESDSSGSSSGSGSSDDDDDASGLGGFQNVLGQWAQASGAASKPSAPKSKPKPQPPQLPPPLSPPALPPEAAQPNSAIVEQIEAGDSTNDAPQNAPEERKERSSSSDSDDGSSFDLQWGDTLRAWAVNAGADARATLEQRQELAMAAAAPTEDATSASRAEASAGPSLAPLSPPNAKQQAGAPEAQAPLQEQASPPAAPSPAIASPPQQPPAPAPPVQMPGSEVVRAWLAREDAPPQGACVPPPPSESAASAATPGGLAPTAAPFVPHTGFRDQVATSTPSLSHSASLIGSAAPPHGLYCSLCNVTASGPKAWMDHLNSRRHASRVRQTAEGTSAAELAALPQPLPSRGAAAATPTGLPAPSRTYVGAGADVAPYVDHIITTELNTAVESLLRRLLEWQDRARRLDPVNARRKRRVVSGMREVEKAAKLGKAKLLVVAPNVGALAAAVGEGEGEEEENRGGVDGSDDANGNSAYPVSAALEWARQKDVPVVFALTRQRLGRLLGARKTASAFAVLDASGAEQALRDLVAAVTAAREEQRQQG